MDKLLCLSNILTDFDEILHDDILILQSLLAVYKLKF